MLIYQYSTPHKGVNSLTVSFLYVQIFLKKKEVVNELNPSYLIVPIENNSTIQGKRKLL